MNTFNPIEQHTWDKIRPLFLETKLKKGACFVEDQQVATKIAFLREGVVRAYYRHNDCTEYNKHFFTPPSFIGGYASLITGRPNQIIQQALTDCELLTADFKKISRLYDTHPDLERLARKLAEMQFVDKEQREIEIVLLDANKRYQIFQKQFPRLEQIIPQYHIAFYLGITPTQLSRVRKKMSKP